MTSPTPRNALKACCTLSVTKIRALNFASDAFALTWIPFVLALAALGIRAVERKDFSVGIVAKRGACQISFRGEFFIWSNLFGLLLKKFNSLIFAFQFLCCAKVGTSVHFILRCVNFVYGLTVHFELLLTPPCSDAATFYRKISPFRSKMFPQLFFYAYWRAKVACSSHSVQFNNPKTICVIRIMTSGDAEKL
jgi:hypothetical protein